MEPMALMTVSITNPASLGEAFSALPNAPVVADDDSAYAVTRVRSAAATGLRRLADAVAPAGSPAMSTGGH